MAQRFLPYWVWVLRPTSVPRVQRMGQVLLKLPYVTIRDLRRPQSLKGMARRRQSLLPAKKAGTPLLVEDQLGVIVPSQVLAWLEVVGDAPRGGTPEAYEVPRPNLLASFYAARNPVAALVKPGKEHLITQFRWDLRSMETGEWWSGVRIYVTPPLVAVHKDRDPRRSIWAIPGVVQRYGIVYMGWFETFRPFSVHDLPPRDLVKLDELLERGKI